MQVVSKMRMNHPPTPKASDELEADKRDTINMYMKKIYQSHLLNAKYNKHTLVFLDPANPNQYILLTIDAFQTWVKALVSYHVMILHSSSGSQYVLVFFCFFEAECKDGVLVMSPPSSLHFKTLLLAKKARLRNMTAASEGSSNINASGLQLLVDLLAAKQSPNQSTSIKSSEAPVSSPPNKSHIEGYISFLGIRYWEHTIDILLSNGFHLHKFFKSSSLARSDFKALGLKLGLVTCCLKMLVWNYSSGR